MVTALRVVGEATELFPTTPIPTILGNHTHIGIVVGGVDQPDIPLPIQPQGPPLFVALFSETASNKATARRDGNIPPKGGITPVAMTENYIILKHKGVSCHSIDSKGLTDSM